MQFAAINPTRRRFLLQNRYEHLKHNRANVDLVEHSYRHEQPLNIACYEPQYNQFKYISELVCTCNKAKYEPAWTLKGDIKLI